jgi:hypothetical protein
VSPQVPPQRTCRRFHRKLREAYAEEGEVPALRKRRTLKDKAEPRRALARCTVCSHPFFECVDVYEHSVLGVSLCYYCHQAEEEATAEQEAGEAAADAASGSDAAAAPCSWCFGANEESDGAEAFGCDSEGCGRWFCASCISTNLGGEQRALRPVGG